MNFEIYSSQGSEQYPYNIVNEICSALRKEGLNPEDYVYHAVGVDETARASALMAIQQWPRDLFFVSPLGELPRVVLSAVEESGLISFYDKKRVFSLDGGYRWVVQSPPVGLIQIVTSLQTDGNCLLLR